MHTFSISLLQLVTERSVRRKLYTFYYSLIPFRNNFLTLNLYNIYLCLTSNICIFNKFFCYKPTKNIEIYNFSVFLISLQIIILKKYYLNIANKNLIFAFFDFTKNQYLVSIVNLSTLIQKNVWFYVFYLV